jgi:two-component system, OmpR family, sensor histidine kinase KdpD
MIAAGASFERPRAPARAQLLGFFRQHVGFVWGALTNVITTSLAFWVAPHAQLAHLMIIHLLGAVLISTRFGMAVSTFTAITGALAFDYYCIPPIFAFALPDPHSVITFAGMLVVALLVCWLNQGLRLQRAAARESEARTQALCELSLDLSQVANRAELSSRAERHLERLFGSGTRLALGERSGIETGFEAQLVGERGHALGYVLIDRRRLQLGSAGERRLLLAACADRVADALKRLALGEAARRAEVDTEMERNRSALLSAVSHDMKTPLASILTAGTSLLSASQLAPTRPGRELLETIVEEAERMNGLITNLLSVTRLEGGRALLNRELEGLDDLIFGVLSRFSGRLSGRQVTIDVPDGLPMVPVDAGLVDLLLVNVLENVLRYTPADSPVDVEISFEQGVMVLDVSDRGPGIAAGERDKVFDKFYRGQAAKRNDGGTGLGLTICRAVARAHDGDICILPRAGGGSTVRFSLPCPGAVRADLFQDSRRLPA